MTCQEVVDFLMAYIDNELPAEQRAVFEQHLQKCPECVCFLESYQKTMQVEKCCCCPEMDAATKVPAGLIQAIMAGLASQTRRANE